MTTSAVFAFLHFAALFGVVATVFLEWQTISAAPTRAEALRLQRCDRWYGLSAMLLVVVGLLRVYYFEKGSAFYFGNPFFNAKLALFVAVGLVSIYPTVRFIKWRAQMRDGGAPKISAEEHRRILWSLRAEVLMLLGAAFCASMMARGIGLR
jgi:putative membrane protein